MAGTVNKNKTANTGKYSYKYVDIAQIHEYLESINASYYQYIERIGEDDYIMTVRILDGEEKPALRGARVVQATLMGVQNPAQQQGSALTYARRYSLLMAFGLATEDDDAQSLSRAKQKTITLEEEKTLKKLIEAVPAQAPLEERIEKICGSYGVQKLMDLNASQYAELAKRLQGQS